MVWDAMALLGGVVLLVGLVAKGYLSPCVAIVMLVVLPLYRGFGRATGGVRGFAYWLGFYGPLVVVLIIKGGTADAIALATAALYGGFEKIVVTIMKLAAEGHVAVGLAVISVLVLAVLRWLGGELASRLLYHYIFSVAAPLFAIAVTLGDLAYARAQSWQETVFVLGSVLVLFLLIEIIYWQVFILFRRTH